MTNIGTWVTTGVEICQDSMKTIDITTILGGNLKSRTSAFAFSKYPQFHGYNLDGNQKYLKALKRLFEKR